MWTREELKTRAKEVLKRSLGWAILVCLVGSLLGGSLAGGGSGGSVGSNAGSSFSNSFQSSGNSSEEYLPGDWNASDLEHFAENPQAAISSNSAAFSVISSTIAIFVLILVLAAFAFTFFVGNPVTMGMARWFNRNRELPQPPNFGMMFDGFRGGTYLKTVGALAWRDLIILLWSLLLIIPGIIKAYAYRMVPWILADNPHIDYKRAMELSDQMTKGHKGDMWVLDLSFIGWSLLAAITCGLGYIVLNPYMCATQAELYAVLRHNALVSGACSFDELGFPVPEGYTPPSYGYGYTQPPTMYPQEGVPPTYNQPTSYPSEPEAPRNDAPPSGPEL